MTAVAGAAGPAGERIGLYGGSFDPVHDAHLALACTALQHLALTELRWIPVGLPWQKSRRLAPAADRAAMIDLAIAGEPRFVLDRSELERPGPSFTLDTVRALQAHRPDAEWFLILGLDQYANLPTWHGWQELVGRVTLAVAARKGIDVPAELALQKAPQRRILLPLLPMAHSSSAVRAAVAAGRAYDDMVPAAVARYIELHHLYTTEAR